MSFFDFNRGAKIRKINAYKILDSIKQSTNNKKTSFLNIVLFSYGNFLVYYPYNEKNMSFFLDKNSLYYIIIASLNSINKSENLELFVNISYSGFLSYKSFVFSVEIDLNWKIKNSFFKYAIGINIERMIDVIFYPVMSTIYSLSLKTYGEKTLVLRRMYADFVINNKNSKNVHTFFENIILSNYTSIKEDDFCFVNYCINSEISIFHEDRNISTKIIKYFLKRILKKTENANNKNFIQKLNIILSKIPNEFEINMHNKFIKENEIVDGIFFSITRFAIIEMRHYITVAIAIDFALSEKTIEKINELYKDNESDLNIPRIVCMNKSSHSKLFFITFNFKKNKLIISEMESEISKEKQKEFFKNFSEINHYEF